MRQIGVLGGGQLGLMLAESIVRHGGHAKVYDPDPDAPAFRATSASTSKPWTDTAALLQFFEDCEAITYEFENVDSSSLPVLEEHKPILPSIGVLQTAQDRILEKTFISNSGLPHVDFSVVESLDRLEPCARAFGFPFIAKTARGGYDGKGQWLVSNEAELQALASDPQLAKNPNVRLILERVLDIAMEVSCIVARSRSGEEVCFPIFENEHKDHILDITVVPARISTTLVKAIEDIALSAARQLGVFGLLTTEFFLSNAPGENTHGVQVGSWHVYINEFAPRPHNSGHVTMKACTISQFDALARILLQIPLVKPDIVAPGFYCMGNLLGDVWLAQGNSSELDLSAIKEFPDVIDVVLYGKKEARAKRKMAHFITYARSAEAAIAQARNFRQCLQELKQPNSCR